MHGPAGSSVVTGASMHDRSADRSAGVSRQRDCPGVVREILRGSPAVILTIQCAYMSVHTQSCNLYLYCYTVLALPHSISRFYLCAQKV